MAAGVLLMTTSRPGKFLLMRHRDRWDLPKGHSEAGESCRQTALREMQEETGLSPTTVRLDDDFEYVIEYPVRYRDDPQPKLKQVHYFLGWVDEPAEIACTEHESCQWFDWQPPQEIQQQTIDPLLAAVAQYLDQR